METDELYSEESFAITEPEDVSDEDVYRALGQRMAGLRDACGYELDQFAQELGVDADEYRGYEESGYGVPAGLLIDMARLCGVDVSEILSGSSARLDTFQVVRAGDGQPIDRYEGYHISDLAYRFSKKIMQPLLVTLDPSEKPADLVMHRGQEFNYVVEGSVAVQIGDQEVTLAVGDSVYFDPRLPHGQKCAGDVPATFVTIVTE